MYINIHTHSDSSDDRHCIWKFRTQNARWARARARWGNVPRKLCVLIFFVIKVHRVFSRIDKRFNGRSISSRHHHAPATIKKKIEPFNKFPSSVSQSSASHSSERWHIKIARRLVRSKWILWNHRLRFGQCEWVLANVTLLQHAVDDHCSLLGGLAMDQVAGRRRRRHRHHRPRHIKRTLWFIYFIPWLLCIRFGLRWRVLETRSINFAVTCSEMTAFMIMQSHLDIASQCLHYSCKCCKRLMRGWINVLRYRQRIPVIFFN